MPRPRRDPPARRGRSGRDRPGRSRSRRDRSGHDRGSASVEFAITAVAVMAVIFAAIQAATYFWARSIALAAAQEGVTAQRAYNASPGAGQARAESFIAATGDGLTATTVTIVADAEQVQVTVSGRCLSVIPGSATHSRSAQPPTAQWSG
jgi:TadE-like protein